MGVDSMTFSVNRATNEMAMLVLELVTAPLNDWRRRTF